MKKTLSVFLSALMILFTMVPVFAANGDETAAEPYSGTTYNVSFVAPSSEFAGGYRYVKSVDGEIQYVEDPNGEYCFYDNRYMLPSNVLPNYRDEIPPERYSPVECENGAVAEGETVAFKILTSEKYNVYTAAVFINGERAVLNAQDEYTVYVDRDITVRVAEYDDNGQPALLRNHYNVKLTSGDGYKLKTLKNENYEVTYYGDSFRFRIDISDGYSAAGIKVSVQRGQAVLGGFLDEEDSDMLVGIMGGTETLTSYGVDEDGCRLYEIQNITTDCRVIVSGVQEEANVGIFAMLKRILRLILDFLGIKIDALDSITAVYEVSIDASEADGVTYEVIRSSEDEISPSNFMVTNGEGITLVVTKKDPDQNVNVAWIPGNELGTAYQTNWILDYNTITGEVTYSAIYNIDNISENIQIIIS